jgi:hypothetical protein
MLFRMIGMLFRMIGMLFGLFVWNSNGELRKTVVILSPIRSRIAVILIVPKQQICFQLHRCYYYSDNNNYSVVLMSSKHTPKV